MLPVRLTPPPLIGVAGMMNSGKSYFINRLIGNYLPSAAVSCTASGVEIAWGEKMERYHLNNGNRRKCLDACEFDRLVRRVVAGRLLLNLPQRELLNLRLFDTPGFNAPNWTTTVKNLRRRGCQGLVWCVNFGSGISNTDLNVLNELASSGVVLLGVVITKTDTANDLDEELPKRCEDTIVRLQKNGLNQRVMTSGRDDPSAQKLWRWLDEGAKQVSTGLDAILRKGESG